MSWFWWVFALFTHFSQELDCLSPINFFLLLLAYLTSELFFISRFSSCFLLLLIFLALIKFVRDLLPAGREAWRKQLFRVKILFLASLAEALKRGAPLKASSSSWHDCVPSLPRTSIQIEMAKISFGSLLVFLERAWPRSVKATRTDPSAFLYMVVGYNRRIGA